MVILVPIVAMSSSSHSNGFDVHFNAYARQHLLIVDHTDRVFRRNRTVPDDMEHYRTVLWARDFKSAALFYYYKSIYT